MDVLKVGEVERRYPDEWVLVEIVRDNKHHERIVGRLVAHTPDRNDLVEVHRRYRANHPEARLYQFYTGDVVAPGVTVIL
jgi:hypothetical protein